MLLLFSVPTFAEDSGSPYSFNPSISSGGVPFYPYINGSVQAQNMQFNYFSVGEVVTLTTISMSDSPDMLVSSSYPNIQFSNYTLSRSLSDLSTVTIIDDQYAGLLASWVYTFGYLESPYAEFKFDNFVLPTSDKSDVYSLLDTTIECYCDGYAVSFDFLFPGDLETLHHFVYTDSDDFFISFSDIINRYKQFDSTIEDKDIGSIFVVELLITPIVSNPEFNWLGNLVYTTPVFIQEELETVIISSTLNFTYVTNSLIDVDASFTRWIGTAVSGFLDFEIYDGYSLGGLLITIVGFLLVLWFLKLFLGG